VSLTGLQAALRRAAEQRSGPFAAPVPAPP